MVYYTPATSHRAVRTAPRVQLCTASWAAGRSREAGLPLRAPPTLLALFCTGAAERPGAGSKDALSEALWACWGKACPALPTLVRKWQQVLGGPVGAFSPRG